MARIVPGTHRGALDPVKLSQPLGAVLAFLGLDRAMPLLHGSQGCSAFAKALLTRHFREPIPLQTSAVTEVTAVLGTGENLLAAIDTVAERTGAQIIGVATTGLVEASGEDLHGLLSARGARAGAGGPLVVAVATPDFEAGLSRGWAKAVEAIVAAGLHLAATGGTGGTGGTGIVDGIGTGSVRRTGPARGRDHLLPVLAGVSLTATDLDEIAALVRAFGLDPLLVPDLSGSLDGHLDDGWSPLTTGGTPRALLPALGTAAAAHAVGVTTASAADTLAGAGTAVTRHDHLSGLAAVDGLVDALRRHTGAEVPADVRRARARFTDTLLDAHFVLDGARIAVAGEPELLAAVTTLAASAGARTVAAVTPTPDPVLGTLPCEEVVLGDLTDLQDRAAEAGAELVIGNGHTRATALAVDAAHLPLGLPVADRLGVALATLAGYGGGRRFLTELANRLLDHRDRTPHRDRTSHRADDRDHAHRTTTAPHPTEESLC